ncbi:MAG: hypothetical protein ACXVWW_14365, partial [Nocardioides sp.]
MNPTDQRGENPEEEPLPMRIALLSTSDTDLLSARASGADWVWANPTRRDGVPEADLVVVRFLGSPHDLPVDLSGVTAPVVVLGGEQQPSADLMEL